MKKKFYSMIYFSLNLLKKLFIGMMLLTIHFNVRAQSHPVLITSTELNSLIGGSDEWTPIEQFCITNLNTLVEPGWAGWDGRIAIENYAKAYQVLKNSNPATATNYGRKALALMKAAARHHNMGGPVNGQYIGLGNGTTTAFTLPFPALTGSTPQVIVSNTEEVAYIYTSNKIAIDRFQPILKISNTAGGTNNYATTDYRISFRDGLDVWILNWLTATHPATNASYYVTYYDENDQVVAPASYNITGTTLTFTTAPPAGQAVFVRMIGQDYEQTGNYMGGVNSVQPDGPGYQMRTYNPALAYGFDLLYDFPDFTTSLKTEFSEVLNEQIEWYENYGYENDGDLGNYFIRGLYTGIMFTAYGTEGANTQTAYLKAQTEIYTDRIFDKLQSTVPGGYGPQGQYTNGTITDILQVFTIYESLTGEDLLSQLEWTDYVIPAIIHGTKPDRESFYDGGDWDNLPAEPLLDGTISFLKYLPDHANAPYARQLLIDAGESTIPSGTVTDYKTIYPKAYFGKICGPVYTRSDWTTSAVWGSFYAGEIFMDHQHFDQGHFTIQRGADYLVLDAGGYGDRNTDPYHNTLLIDDRGAGDISTYPPGQGAWGFADNKITRFENKISYTYSTANITRAYARHHDGLQNSVELAFRTFMFIRPQLIIIHDKVITPNVNVDKIFNCNFPSLPVLSGGTYSVTKGSSKLFYKPIVPSATAPVFSAVTIDPAYRNSKITTSGQAASTLLNVFEAVPSSTPAMTALRYIDITNMEGLEISKTDSNWVALFAKEDTLLDADVVQYNFINSGAQKHVLADLNINYDYEVTAIVNGIKILDKQVRTSSSQGIVDITFNALAGGTVFITKPGITSVIHATATSPVKNVYFVNDKLKVEIYSPTATTINFKIYSLTGVLLQEFDHSVVSGQNQLEKDLSELPHGMHLIRVENETFKIIK